MPAARHGAEPLGSGKPFVAQLGVKGSAKQNLVGANAGTAYAYVMDDPCGDNSGRTVLAITKTE